MTIKERSQIWKKTQATPCNFKYQINYFAAQKKCLISFEYVAPGYKQWKTEVNAVKDLQSHVYCMGHA